MPGSGLEGNMPNTRFTARFQAARRANACAASSISCAMMVATGAAGAVATCARTEGAKMDGAQAQRSAPDKARATKVMNEPPNERLPRAETPLVLFSAPASQAVNI